MRLLSSVLLVGLVACAQAHNDQITGRPDSGITIGDSNMGGGDSSGMVDAPMQHIDAPMGGTMTLTQTTANNDTQVGIACSGQNTTTYWTNQNSYYRVFTLSEYGITGTFHVTGVDFIDSYSLNSPQLKVSLGTYSGTPGANNLTPSAITLGPSTTITPADTTTPVPQHVDIAGDVTGNLLVEIDQVTAGTSSNTIRFYIGANEAGETHPGYFSSPVSGCGVTTPTSMNAVAQAQPMPSMSHMVLTVTGTY
jgi:hypothetical protein